VPNCAEGGVLGVLPGIIGTMQALEVIKVITGVGDILDGRLFTFDALSFESRTLNFKPDPANPLNGSNPTIFDLIDYEEFCNTKDTQRTIKEVSSKSFINGRFLVKIFNSLMSASRLSTKFQPGSGVDAIRDNTIPGR